MQTDKPLRVTLIALILINLLFLAAFIGHALRPPKQGAGGTPGQQYGQSPNLFVFTVNGTAQPQYWGVHAESREKAQKFFNANVTVLTEAQWEEYKVLSRGLEKPEEQRLHMIR